jgi:hypothetical protein
MRPFMPEIHIAAVDDHDAVVIFDSGASYDRKRCVRTVRLARKFQQLSLSVEGFDVSSTLESDDENEFHAEVHLRVKGTDGQEVQHVLAQLQWRLEANRSWGRAQGLPEAEQVAEHVRQGIAGALSHALKSYYEKEAHLDTLARTGHEPGDPPTILESREPPKTRGWSLRPRERALSPAHADARRNRVRMITAMVGAPVLLLACLMIVSPKRHDPVAEAVARSMVQNPALVQEQVDLTARTLKQMGLDPGHSNDVGCLASAP